MTSILKLQIQPYFSVHQLLQSPRAPLYRPTIRSHATQSTTVSDDTAKACNQTVIRRTANYHRNIWDFNFIQSLTTEYTEDMYINHTMILKEPIRKLLSSADMGCLEQLELIDALQRLGIGYHFEKEIRECLGVIHTANVFLSTGGLHETALGFRLLRQHGYQISQDVFLNFKDKKGTFSLTPSDDYEGLLSLYEASYLAVEGENILNEMRDFARKHLQDITTPISPQLAKQITRSLELPLHWRMLRLDARWYIEGGLMTTRDHITSNILEAAKQDFNILQMMHRKDLKEVSKWWRDCGLGSHAELSFARDRLMENFFWTIGVNAYPQFSDFRRGGTKVNALVTTIDDVYDVYGTLEELKLFTDAVERWDINSIDQLPYYMKICFMALYNTVNEMAYVTLKEQGSNVTRYLKKSWTELCKAYLVEAKWFYSKYTPTLEEYLNNAWISISAPLILIHAYVLSKHEITEDTMNYLEGYPDIVRCSSMILRLSDDLGTSSAEIARGDVPKSIQCYMNETGCSEESAREHIRGLIGETWKKMNKCWVDHSILPQPFMETAVNLARMAQCMYQYGDGHGIQDQETKGRVVSLLVDPIISCMSAKDDHSNSNKSIIS